MKSQHKKPIVLCIMDGWGLTDLNPGNAVALASTPNYDALWNKYPHATLLASGTAVGLPEGQMGNSEVGHMNLGAGRIVYTGLSLINKDIADGVFVSKPEFARIFAEVKKRKSKLHVMGLVSAGGVHSHTDHLMAFMDAAQANEVPYVLHAFTDGRDVSPDAALTDFVTIDQKLKATNGSWGLISGRYYAMDRDRRWERTALVYDALTQNQCDQRYQEPLSYLKAQHAEGITDEFIKPALATDFDQKMIQDNDVVFFFNFRPDRARQLSHLLRGSDQLYDYVPAFQVKNIFLATLMTYEKIIIDEVIYPPFAIEDTLGAILARHNKSQIRIAETEKYPHVTFFFDGGREVEYQDTKRILVPSPKVATYDLQPEMSAKEITEKLLPELAQHDVVILNYANPDMVGHTGVITATIKAVETVDHQIGVLEKAVSSLGGVMIIIADHGNAEVKLDEFNKPATSHTTNPVPLIVTDSSVSLRTDGILGDIAPTILDYLGIPQPEAMTRSTLIKSRRLP
ncbi:2,3-bisphosphoglycerate-independent phosphoglycerate mutase [Mycoplasmoides fastidiosum]|uniref:2,3-bisphosphoglycerate-independent phosphoglycerate mutase n=1 Tax=Mycoplasmoides fastidiosum TaxID=92758 RepID=A0ABU0LZA9_9BACT|nr:2,3-bisphosphoglycerate-independent phosphoglycerate mutase [Mycoplasmoides fastidiosum]MDQ0514022.1 2,3-bisphosphoglycerate-independent phosphoglycerate mutase [Mycoplasmoides fastidiosum]UUD37568.1 2,3-bisphosphoglycerate-independent phosphoglycerate mutase [Mycoplasmoides fastidiosum]